MAPVQPRNFQTTRWSLVVAAGGTTSPRSRAALSELCQLYWHPVHAFIQHRARSPDAAKDLTQGFFADVLERKDIGAADPARGKFRSWLLGCAKNFLANERDHELAKKRGGGALAVPLEAEELAADATAEQLYMRRWAMQLVGRVLAEMREEKVQAGKVERFDVLRPYLVDEGEESYAQLGEQLGISEGAVKVSIYVLRELFRERLRTEIALTLMPEDDIDEEVRELLASLA